MEFPNRVWEPTGLNNNGTFLWSSREPTKEDIERRKKIKEEREKRHAKGQ